MRRPGSTRGQATVELALGSLLFVTLLLLGIFLSETAFLGLKVSEAANFATWYGSGLRVHHFKNNAATNTNSIYRPFNSVVPSAQSEAQARYTDYDGFDKTGGGTVREALADASPLRVQCRVDPAVGFALNPARMPSDAAFPQAVRDTMQRYYQDKGAVSCTADASITAGRGRMPDHFFERGEGGTFHDSLWSSATIHLCGAGRARNGQCKGELAMLVGDWALDGPQSQPDANGNFRYQSQGDNFNWPLRNMVENLWNVDGTARGHAAAKFAAMLSRNSGNYRRDSPYQEDQFFNSYAGFEHSYWDLTPPGFYWDDTTGEGSGGWTFTVPVRGNCFLGRNDGCNQPMPNQSF